jgi:hypothetical protein
MSWHLSPKAGVEKSEPLLKDLQLKGLDAKVLEEERAGEKAYGSVKVRLFVVIGQVVQIERYTLKGIVNLIDILVPHSTWPSGAGLNTPTLLRFCYNTWFSGVSVPENAGINYCSLRP